MSECRTVAMMTNLWTSSCRLVFWIVFVTIVVDVTDTGSRQYSTVQCKMALVDVENLTDSEIRHKLLELGCSVGPVTATTRKILLKKLKLLLEEEGNKSISSGENQGILHTNLDGGISGAAKSRRRTPPRSTSRSPKRRSPARSNVSSTQTDYVVSGRTSDVGILASSTITNGSKRPTRSSISHDTPAKSTNFSFKGDYENSRYVPGVSSTLQSHGHSDLPAQSVTSRYLNSSLSSDAFRTRFDESNDTDFNLSVSQSISSAPFSSDFVKRLSGSRQTQRTDYRSSISGISSKLLDVKESDDEDTGPSPVYAKFSQSSLRGAPVTNTKHTRRTTATEGWLPFDSPISTILLGIFLLFFVLIGVTYINMHSSDTNLSSPSDIIFPLCLNLNSHVPGENCIRDADKETVLKLFNIMYKVHYETLMNGPCNGKKQEPVLFSDDDVINMIVEHDKTMSVWVVEQHLKNLKVLLEANPKWKIKPSRQGITIEEPPISYYCFILSNFFVAADWLFKITLGCGFFYLVYLVVRWWMIREARYKEEVYKLVSNIIDIVSSKAQTPDSFIPISHVRDQLIAPKDRARK
uniref:LEM domain-containing protein n=1 Tax=Rhodnius prolixus TaxID=13249 RepID=T1HBW6_RHOPR